VKGSFHDDHVVAYYFRVGLSFAGKSWNFLRLAAVKTPLGLEFGGVYDNPMSTVKEQVLHAVNRLPADADFRDVNEEIALLAAVAEAEEDIREGKLVSNEEMKTRLDQWLDGQAD